MALTQQQEISNVFKKLLGVAETSANKQFFEEPYQSSIIVTPNQIWYDAGQIPHPAPTITPISQVDPATGLTLVYGDSGVVRYYLWLVLQPVAGSPNAFFHPCLRNTIPFNFDMNGSYVYRLRNANSFDIAFGSQDWLVDPVAGTLTFYGSNLSSIGVDASHPPKISFYRYIGRLGIPDSGGGGVYLPLLDNNIFLASASNPAATAQFLVGSPAGNTTYTFPESRAMATIIVTDDTLNEVMDARGVVDGGQS
jgi:hypothetical protein